MYMLQLMDSYAATYSVLVIALVECLALAWVYGKATHVLFPAVCLWKCFPRKKGNVSYNTHVYQSYIGILTFASKC